MTHIVVVYHSGFGHTKKVAEHIGLGAQKVAGTTVRVIDVDAAQQDWGVLNAADAIIFGAPTYMGSVSAPFKTFMDASSKIWMGFGWKDKVAAGFTNSGSPSGDKLNALQQISIFAAQHGMIWVGTGLMPSADEAGNYGKGKLNRLGSMLGVMTQSDNAPADVTPPAEDLATAAYLGERVATITKKLKS